MSTKNKRRAAGRPPSANPLGERILIRATRAQRLEWEAAAARESVTQGREVTLSEWLRDAGEQRLRRDRG